MIYVRGCGVMIFNEEGKLLMGRRSDGQGWCIPGGKVDPGEEEIDAAIRETMEEAGIQLEKEMVRFLGAIVSQARVKGKLSPVASGIYITQGMFNPISTEELEDVQFFGMYELPAHIFPPTREALSLLSTQEAAR